MDLGGAIALLVRGRAEGQRAHACAHIQETGEASRSLDGRYPIRRRLTRTTLGAPPGTGLGNPPMETGAQGTLDGYGTVQASLTTAGNPRKARL